MATPDLELTFRDGGTGDAVDSYTVLDRFGRLVETLWKVPGTGDARVQSQYGRNRVGGVVWRGGGTARRTRRVWTRRTTTTGMLMHLAAAVETKRGKPKNRACVVVAGRCEPMQWEAYPHQYVHTNGALRCCDNGGCWKSHTIPLGDGDEKDNAENLCVDVVTKEIPRAAGNSGKRGVETYSLPRCMDMITAEEIVRCIELYYTGGALSYLTLQQARLVRSIINSPA